MYEFARGPLVWIAFMVFIFGSIYQLVRVRKLAIKDKVVFPYLNFKYGLRSVFHWLAPFGTHNMRRRWAFTTVSFLFHFGLLVTPIFVLGHILLIRESWNIAWWNMPESVTNGMTIMVVVLGGFFAFRRVADPTVRLVSNYVDWLVLLIVLAPFITGLLAYYQVFEYQIAITAHMFTGALWLMAIPFTRLSHMLFFIFTRAYMGSEFGFVRHSKDW